MIVPFIALIWAQPNVCLTINKFRCRAIQYERISWQIIVGAHGLVPYWGSQLVATLYIYYYTWMGCASKNRTILRVCIPDPHACILKSKWVWGHWGILIFLVLRTITWPYVLQYKPMQITILWLLNLQNYARISTNAVSPDPFLLIGVGSELRWESD